MIVNRYEITPWANLSWTDFSGTDLHDANLSWADLHGINLSWANLHGINLSGADLHGANLYNADLRHADLRDANLLETDLRGANLCNANLRGAKLSNFQIPQKGTLRVFKSVHGVIVTLRIPAGVERTGSLVGNKCRAAKAYVEEIFFRYNSITSHPNAGIPAKYTVGCMVLPDSYNGDIRMECTNGIHFYRTRREAANSGF